jgi:NADPH-dependent ferric siderophore reductase
VPVAVHATVFVEVPDARDIRPLPTPGTVDVARIVPTKSDSLLEALKSADLPDDADYAWVAGESSMIKAVRENRRSDPSGRPSRPLRPKKCGS